MSVVQQVSTNIHVDGHVFTTLCFSDGKIQYLPYWAKANDVMGKSFDEALGCFHQQKTSTNDIHACPYCGYPLDRVASHISAETIRCYNVHCTPIMEHVALKHLHVLYQDQSKVVDTFINDSFVALRSTIRPFDLVELSRSRDVRVTSAFPDLAKRIRALTPFRFMQLMQIPTAYNDELMAFCQQFRTAKEMVTSLLRPSSLFPVTHFGHREDVHRAIGISVRSTNLAFALALVEI